MLEKAGGGGAPLRRVGAESPEAWLPAATIGGPKALSPGGGEGHREWSEMLCRLSGRKPASQTPARWVAWLCVDRLSVVD